MVWQGMVGYGIAWRGLYEMDVCMDGYLDGCMGGCMDAWRGIWMDGDMIYGGMYGCTDPECMDD